MRIKEEEAALFKHKIHSIDPQAKVYIFGSRADDARRGGDIDLLIISTKKLTLAERTEIKYGFIEKFGEQKIDLVNFTFNEPDTFKELIMGDAVEL